MYTYVNNYSTANLKPMTDARKTRTRNLHEIEHALFDANFVDRIRRISINQSSRPHVTWDWKLAGSQTDSEEYGLYYIVGL